MIASSIRTAAGTAALGMGLILMTAGAAEAQRTIGGFPRSDQSDVTGPAVTSGDQLAPLFAEPGTVRSMACSVAWGVRTASDRVRGLLESGSLAPADAIASAVTGGSLMASTRLVSAPRGPRSISEAAQRAVLGLLVATDGAGNAEEPVLAALVRGNTTATRQARRLVTEARGLLAVIETMDPRRPGREGPTRLARVTGLYNAFVDASADAFIASPPDELLALHAVLDELVQASIENAGRDGDPNQVDDSGLACAGPSTPLIPVVVEAPPADRPFEMCALVNGDFRIAAGLLTADGDSVAIVDDRRVPFSSVYTAASEVPTPAWVSRGDAVTIDGVRYQPFGVTRAVQPGEVFRRGYHEGFEYFAAAGEAESAVIYFVAGTNCVVQPYRSVETIRVRG